MSKSISAILPNYNGRHLLEKNLPSLIASLDSIDHEIIVVDDCSADDSTSFLEQHYPQVRLVKNETNMGFSYTCNRGIKAAGRDLLCLANTDVTFTPDYFTSMLDEFDDDMLFAVKGDIINYRDNFDDVLNIDRTTRLYYKRGFLRFDTREPLTVKTAFSGNDEHFVALGCCFVCDRQMTTRLGGFDEIYSPFYWEDSDLARRAMQAGYKLLYLPECVVYHQASSTLSNYRSKSLRQLVSGRNKFLFTWRHMDRNKLWLLHAPATALNILTRWIILDWKYYAALYQAIIRIITYPEPVT